MLANPMKRFTQFIGFARKTGASQLPLLRVVASIS